MVLLFLVGKTLQFARIARNPLTKALPRSAQKVAAGKFIVDVTRGLVPRLLVNVAVGLVFDPFNLLIVPASRGRLITTGQASAEILDFKITRKGLTTIVLATPAFAFDLGIDVTAKAFRGGTRAGMMIAGVVQAKAERGAVAFGFTGQTASEFLPGFRDPF